MHNEEFDVFAEEARQTKIKIRIKLLGAFAFILLIAFAVNQGPPASRKSSLPVQSKLVDFTIYDTIKQTEIDHLPLGKYPKDEEAFISTINQYTLLQQKMSMIADVGSKRKSLSEREKRFYKKEIVSILECQTGVILTGWTVSTEYLESIDGLNFKNHFRDSLIGAVRLIEEGERNAANKKINSIQIYAIELTTSRMLNSFWSYIKLVNDSLASKSPKAAATLRKSYYDLYIKEDHD